MSILLAITLCCSVVLADQHNEETSGLPPNLCQTKKWDYLVFSQQWPQTACQKWKDSSLQHECEIPATINSWTVHGIWPSANKGNDPSFCNQTWKFNITQLQPLISELMIHWPNIYKGTTQDDLWKHEWNKHGTCATSDAYFEDEYNYFQVGLELLKKYNLNEILWTNEIVPSLVVSYKLSDFHSAILNSLGVDPTIACCKVSKQHWIQEIRICLDKQLVIIECPDELRANLGADQSCPKDGLVIYPPIQPTSPSLLDTLTHAEL